MWLAIETSSAVSSVAISDGYTIIGEITIQAGLMHSQQLVPHIQSLCTMTGVKQQELTGIVVSIGPGSFTGLRIGLGTAKAMAYALQIPIYGVMTMDALAYEAVHTNQEIHVIIDAQKQHVYEGIYQSVDDTLHCLQQPVVRSVDDVLADCAGKAVIFMGDGLKKLKKRSLEPQWHLANPLIASPRASALIMCSLERLTTGDSDDVMAVNPFYIRESEAEVVWRNKHAGEPQGPQPSVIVTETAAQLQRGDDDHSSSIH